MNNVFSSGLVTKKSGCGDFDVLLGHIQKAWEAENARNLIAYMKLASMVGLVLKIIKLIV